MAIWIKVIVVIVGLVIVGLGSVIRIGSGRWSDSTVRLKNRLMEFTDSEASRVFRLEELEGLPAPGGAVFPFSTEGGTAHSKLRSAGTEGKVPHGGIR